VLHSTRTVSAASNWLPWLATIGSIINSQTCCTGDTLACREVYAHESDELLRADVLKADVMLEAEKVDDEICRVA